MSKTRCDTTVEEEDLRERRGTWKGSPEISPLNYGGNIKLKHGYTKEGTVKT